MMQNFALIVIDLMSLLALLVFRKRWHGVANVGVYVMIANYIASIFFWCAFGAGGEWATRMAPAAMWVNHISMAFFFLMAVMGWHRQSCEKSSARCPTKPVLTATAFRMGQPAPQIPPSPIQT